MRIECIFPPSAFLLILSHTQWRDVFSRVNYDLINIKSLRTFLLTRDIKKYINSNTALIFRNAFLCRKILSNHFYLHCFLFVAFWAHILEKEMATHSSTLAWRIPWTEEPGGLQSVGSKRVRHDFTFTLTFHSHALEKEMATHSSVLS